MTEIRNTLIRGYCQDDRKPSKVVGKGKLPVREKEGTSGVLKAKEGSVSRIKDQLLTIQVRQDLKRTVNLVTWRSLVTWESPMATGGWEILIDAIENERKGRRWILVR